jgi:diguanylate cyclase (GGDEF)-like protein
VAEHDVLTDLPNRVLLLDRLSQALAVAQRRRTLLAILFLDLDRFKNINDAMGHNVGDLVLKEVAARLVKCVRAGDTVSRQGGDEFIILLAEIGDANQVAHVASNVMQAVTAQCKIGDMEMRLATSIGISIFPDDGDDMDTLIKNADIAMYWAKGHGRNRFQFFNPELDAHVVERVTLENGLRKALDRHEFFLEYQPQVDVGTGATIAAEALIRWRHPELGLLMPDRFIRVAEDCGLITPIGHRVLATACRQARSWLDSGHPIVVAVHLSSTDFEQNDVVRDVIAALEHAALPARYLELETTESFVMQGNVATIGILQALRKIGVGLAIDDFGTGYSSLSYLRHFPIHKLKIDRSFMRDVTDAPGSGAIITAIIAMARSLKLRVIAEGVETIEQLQFLRAQGCDEYQGFYASAAVQATELSKRLA